MTMTNLSTNNPSVGQATAELTTTRVLSIFAAALLGLFIVGGVGFSHFEAVHNAAHDYRHSTGFPCH
jgi:cobalt transporter subunit CbtB